MAHVALPPLVVITVLQLCRAEITKVQGTWYSANAINDVYSPKPISELFTTDNEQTYPTLFSVTKPIVVLPMSTTNEYKLPPDVTSNLKTTAFNPPTITQTYNIPEISTVPTTSLSTFDPLLTFSTTPAPPLTFSTMAPSSLSTLQTPSTFSTIPTLSVSSIEPQTVTRSKTTSVVIENNNEQQTNLQSTFNTNSLPPQTELFDLSQTPPFPTTTRQPPVNVPPNYFVIYQQALQNIQTFSQSPPQTQPSPQASTNTEITISTLPPSTSIISSTLPPSTVTIVPSSQTSKVSISTNPCATRSHLTTPISSTVSPKPLPVRTLTHKGLPPNVMIRVVAPKGSITNLKFVATTTKRPTTRRTKKPKKNSYEGCLNSCKGRKDPICANPLAALIIDPNTLKGFPSICHLACHNSYKDNPYEKLVDGRCSRLRTRIMDVNSKTKLRRDELLKSQYSIVNNAARTVVEVSNLRQ
ncbi:uncharacterized protein ACR2FA_000886 [Aphomia sociella]